jgi:rhomboid protease GluP
MMDLQFFLAVNLIAISAIVVAQGLVMRPEGYLPWVIVNAFIVVLGTVLIVFLPAWSGLIVGLAFAAFVAAPIWLGRQAMQAHMAGNVPKAARFAKIAALLHPSEAQRRNSDILSALARGAAGDTTAMAELAEKQGPGARSYVELHAAVERGDWAAALRHTRAIPARNAEVATAEVRALGELGQLDDMVDALMRATEGRMATTTHTLPVLFTLAFAGRFEAVRNLLETRLSTLDLDTKTYWAAVADLAAGNVTGKGRVALEQLAQAAQLPRVKAAAQRALIRPFEENARHMSGVSRATVTALEQRIPALPGASASTGNAASTGSVPQIPRATMPQEQGALVRFPVTWFFIVACCIGYAIQIYAGNAQSVTQMIRLGGLWPEAVYQGEWWRVITSTLLHGDPIHLAVNMLALWSLGVDYEDLAGSWRMLLVYVLSGVGACIAVLWLMWVGITPVTVLVGASGAIYGLFGAITAHAGLLYMRTRDAGHLARLVNILVVLAINLVITFAVPNISFSAHALGFGIGFVLSLIFILAPSRRAA